MDILSNIANNQFTEQELLVEDIADQFDLNWEVIKQRNHYKHPTMSGVWLKSSTNELYRSDNLRPLASVSDQYQVSQPKELIDLVLRGTKGFGELDIHKGGPINGGKKIYMQFKLKGSDFVRDSEIIKYITVLDSNDKSSGISFGIGNYDMWCQNQFRKFYKEGFSKIYHNSSMERKLEEIPATIEFLLSQHMKMIDLYKDLSETHVDTEVLQNFAFEMLDINREEYEDKKVSGVSRNKIQRFNNALRVEVGHRGRNLFALQSATTRYTTHHMSHPRRANGFDESLLSGGIYNLNNKSLDYVTDLMNA